MKITAIQKAVLKTIYDAAPNELKGLEILDRTTIPFFYFWQQPLPFSALHPALKKLKDLDLINVTSGIRRSVSILLRSP